MAVQSVCIVDVQKACDYVYKHPLHVDNILHVKSAKTVLYP